MTAQLHELLILDGETTSMTFCPHFPTDHPRIVQAEEIDNRSEGFDFGDVLILSSTACWRGYQGMWEIRDSHFYLRTLRGCWRVTDGDPLQANWFSGVLRIPRGEQLAYVHMGFGSVYEQELHIRIDQGRVTRRQLIDTRHKVADADRLGWENLPGFENHFEGDNL